ncbi:MAG: type IV toxin-antitoxin system AbiEi family antitoxin domain-containing protein [Thermoleophilia bacterium]
MNTKPSATLRFLEDHEVFTLEEYMGAVDPTVSERTRYTNLQNAVARGSAYRVRRGLYASNLGVYRDRVPNVYLIAAKAAGDAVLTHHSALEAHGVAHSPLRTVYFTSGTKMRDFEVRGYRFHRVAPPPTPGSSAPLNGFVTLVRAGEAIVPVSTKERTLVDCLRDLRLAGGLEELLRSVGGFTSMSAERVAAYARLLGSPTLVARAGWILEMFGERWRVDASVLEEMRSSLGRGTYRLLPAAGRSQQEFVGRWRLYVPADLPYHEWARG